MTKLALLRRFATGWDGTLAGASEPDSAVLAAGSGLEIASPPDLAITALPVAAMMLARYESDVELLCRLFDVARPDGLRVILRPMPAGLPAARQGTRIYCDLTTAPRENAPRPLRSCHLLATQLVELLADRQGAGWDGGSAHGEALSRVLAGALYPGWRPAFTSGRWWLDDGRPDVVTARIESDDDAVAVGGSALFLHYLHDGLGHDWTSIVHTEAPTLAVAYGRLCATAGDPFRAFRSALGSVPEDGSIANFPNADNPFPIERLAPPTPRAARQPAQSRAPEPDNPAITPTALTDALAHRRWWAVRTPMCHVRAEDVFVPEVYDALVRRFRERFSGGEFARSLPGYDASAAAVTRANAGPFGVFLTREWHDVIAGLFGVAASGDVNVTLHHHAPGSESGAVHNDLNPGWFLRPEPSALQRDINVHDPAGCNYRTGLSAAGHATVERVRAIGLIYYLDTPADVRGGGTGLYRCGHQPVTAPDVLVPPKNNALVAFECTPFSFHSFITNAGGPRNCVTMWLHRDRQHVVDRWGADSIVGWS